MRLGLIAGGFKPFTTGHFALLASALADSDVVIVYYGLAGRKKGSGYSYTREMSEQIFRIVKSAIEREYAGKAFVQLGKPTPIVNLFQTIEEVALGEDKYGRLSAVGIDPDQVDQVSVFSSPEDLISYEKYLGTPKEEKYFGDLYQTGRLRFVGVSSAGNDLSKILDAVRNAYPNASDEELTDLIQMRGSVFRSMIPSRNVAKISRYLPNFLTDDEKAQIVDILIRGLSTSEGIFRQYVQAVLKGSR